MAQTLRRVGIVGGVRTPFCRSNTLYADLSNLDLMTAALNGLVEKYRLKGTHIDEVVGGAVVTHSKDFNLTREAVLGTRLAPSTPGITLQQACGTSLQSAAMIGAKIATGEIECGIATGSDTTSDAPIVTEPRTGLSMGQHCELMAREWKIPRQDQDRFAFESHRKGAEAYRSGYMDDLIVPTAGVYRDNNLREDISLDKLATLKTAFDKSDKGTLTAANSTPMTDGAACVLLASEEWAAKRGLAIESFLSYTQSSANNFVAGEGLLMAPTIAVSRILDRAHMTLQDFDFYEIHEAFAAQVLATLKAWEDPEYCQTHLGKEHPLGSLDRTKLNVKGSSLAFGHPFAATGARVLANLSKLLADNGGRGLISICTAGGMGVAAILESAKRAEARVAA